MTNKFDAELYEAMFPWDKEVEHVFVNGETGDLLVIKEDDAAQHFTVRPDPRTGGRIIRKDGQSALEFLKLNLIPPLVYLGTL